MREIILIVVIVDLSQEMTALNTLNVDGNNPQPEYLTPVCFVQMSQNNATYWGAQEEYAESIGLEKKDTVLGGEKTQGIVSLGRFQALIPAGFRK